MTAREKDLEKFVGRTISDSGDKSVFKCVGYSLIKGLPIKGLLIVDAGEDGWHSLDTDEPAYPVLRPSQTAFGSGSR